MGQGGSGGAVNEVADLMSYINTCQQTERNVLIKFVQRFTLNEVLMQFI